MSDSSRDPVYVVTRGGRRVEPENYLSLKSAQERASKLIHMIRSYDKKSERKENIVEIKKTVTPHRIR
tara:strand:+ start:895 stop:1098 length:204 start_codon:yes stop_codon:yes gene_type:complete